MSLPRRRLGPLSVSALRYEPGTQLARHHHANASLSLILEGHQRESVGPHHYDCARHSAVLKGAGIEHANTVGVRATQGLCVEMTSETEAALCEAAGRQLGATCFTDGATRHLVRRIGQELRLRQPGASLIVEGLLFELLGTLVRKRSLEAATRRVAESGDLDQLHRLPGRICRPEPSHSAVSRPVRADPRGIPPDHLLGPPKATILPAANNHSSLPRATA